MTQTQSHYRVRTKAAIGVPVNELARLIKNLSDDDLEMLEMKLTGQHSTLKKRVKEVKEKKVQFLLHKEVFGKK